MTKIKNPHKLARGLMLGDDGKYYQVSGTYFLTEQGSFYPCEIGDGKWVAYAHQIDTEPQLTA
jgi:hypothetical protein